MKANELRIWNLVKYRGENWRISSIFDNGIIQLVRFKIYKAANISEIEPISLTEEWLLKFGFKKRKNRHLFHWENKIVVSEYKDEFEKFFFPKTGYDIRFSNEIKCVHQLQNLYFALIQEELKIK